MQKTLITILLGFIISSSAIAQTQEFKQDTIVYYMKAPYTMAKSKADANFIRFVTNADSGMYNYNDFYKNGKNMLSVKSTVNTMSFLPGAQGYCIEFFENGHRKKITNYAKGEIVGDVITYYNNGNIYNIKSYDDKRMAYLKQCNDSTGKLLAESGNGTWIDYKDDFISYSTGTVQNGVKIGNWKEYKNGSPESTRFFNYGNLKSEDTLDKAFTKVDVDAKFKGNIADYLSRNIKYTNAASEAKIHGMVILQFIVETDGLVKEIKIIRGLGYGLDEVAMDVIKKTRWTPATIASKKVRMQVVIPINFNY